MKIKEWFEKHRRWVFLSVVILFLLIVQPGRYQYSRQRAAVFKLDRWTGKQWVSRGNGWEKCWSEYQQPPVRRNRFEDLIPPGK